MTRPTPLLGRPGIAWQDELLARARGLWRTPTPTPAVARDLDARLRELPALSPRRAGVAGSTVEEQTEALRVIAEHAQAHTALLRLLAGPALDDAALAEGGVTLPDLFTAPMIYRRPAFRVGEVLRFDRPSLFVRVAVFEQTPFGGVWPGVRFYTAPLPPPELPPDATAALTPPVTLFGGDRFETNQGIPWVVYGMLLVDALGGSDLELDLEVFAR